MLLHLRSALFNLGLCLWTLGLGLIALPVLFGPPLMVTRLARFWMGGVLALARVICGLTWEVRGPVPTGPCIVASRHQSSWEIFALPQVLPNASFVLKQELLRVPVLGLYIRRAGMMPIDRDAGAKAVRRIVAGGQAAREAGRAIIIFPEGTRVPPGEHRAHHPSGVLALYRLLDLPLVPVALNSGVFWARRGWPIRPGRIVLEFLEPIPPGRDPREVGALLQERVDSASDRLVEEAGGPPA